MHRVPSIKKLQKICFRSSPDIYRKISIYFTRWALMAEIKANTITVLRAIFLLTGIIIFSLAPITIFWMIIGILMLQLAVFLDTMDGAIARYNKEASFSGEVSDFILDHLSSSVLYFLLAGILNYRLFESRNLLFIAIATAVMAQLAAFLRAIYAEYKVDVEQMRQQSLFSFFHQDNMRLLLLVFTITGIYHFFNTKAFSSITILYFEFIVIKTIYLGLVLWILIRKFPITKQLIKAYTISFFYAISRSQKLKTKLQNYKNTSVAQAALKL